MSIGIGIKSQAQVAAVKPISIMSPPLKVKVQISYLVIPLVIDYSENGIKEVVKKGCYVDLFGLAR